jgi:hypothetical protein
MSHRLMTAKEAAGYLRCGVSTLNRLRVSGGGPHYMKATGRVLYDVLDLDAWIEGSKRHSTSERAA